MSSEQTDQQLSERLAREMGVAWYVRLNEWMDSRCIHPVKKFPNLFKDTQPAREFALQYAWPRLVRIGCPVCLSESLQGVAIGFRFIETGKEFISLAFYPTPTEAINRALADVLPRDEEGTTDV